MNRKQPYIFVDHFAGFEIFFVSDPSVTRGRAKMFLHPDDYAELKDKSQTQTAR